jgi:signal transduction histidine kinase
MPRRQANDKTNMSDAAQPSGTTSDKDIELRWLRRELAQVQAQLEQSRLRKSSLLAMAVHDLRTPLAIIQGYAQLLATEIDAAADSPTAEYITNILSHSDSLGVMIENLLALDQIERGDLRLSPTPCNLNEMVDQTIAQIEGLLKIKSLNLVYHAAMTPAWVDVDEAQIHRALFNMISHTIKYARPNTQLRVDVDHDARYCRVEMHDPHRQLPAEMLAKLFDLVEINRDGIASLRGMDMGLVLTRHLAEHHGGRVAAVCAPDRGMTLALYLPVGKR